MPRRHREKPGAAEALRKVVQIQVAMGRHYEDDDDKIRTDIKSAFQEACDGDEPFLDVVDVEGEGPTEVVDHAGMFRIVFENHNLDRSNQVAQASWFAVVTQAIEAELEGDRD